MASTTGKGAAADDSLKPTVVSGAPPAVAPALPPAPAKVKIHFQAVGSAKRMRKMKFMIASTYRFAFIAEFVRKQLGLTSGQSLFLYVRSSFAPALDTPVAELFRCFSVGGELIVNYSMTEAWG